MAAGWRPASRFGARSNASTLATCAPCSSCPAATFSSSTRSSPACSAGTSAPMREGSYGTVAASRYRPTAGWLRWSAGTGRGYPCGMHGPGAHCRGRCTSRRIRRRSALGTACVRTCSPGRAMCLPRWSLAWATWTPSAPSGWTPARGCAPCPRPAPRALRPRRRKWASTAALSRSASVRSPTACSSRSPPTRAGSWRGCLRALPHPSPGASKFGSVDTLLR
mmetsp:Transcript_115567/g.331743  ORF Transcript_115567/g.331743 Transcript_115567/m.331743 type:complete len:222 (-) Transcript_115567:582-1247(-)